MWTTYLIENEAGTIYIGATSDLDKRIVSHNRERGPDWTQGKGPWKIIYTEIFQTAVEAKKKEQKLKSLKAGKRIKQILGVMI